jgi:endonuclease/exonuclease/phosphatase family metal-dependent hydrolase
VTTPHAGHRPSTLTIASYNIHRGVGMDRRLDLARIADVIAETGADIVGLQEVIREDGREHGRHDADHAAFLAARLGMEFVMGETRAHGRGTYGNAVLTRLPVVGSARCDLSWRTREARGCLRVDLGVGGTVLHVFNCHLGLNLRERRSQLDLLAGFIAVSHQLPGPRVLMGDFNEWHFGPITRGLRREFASPMRRLRLRRTHPSWFPLFKLDRIYWDGALEGREFHVHRSRLARMASDHLPVLCRLEVRLSLAGRADRQMGGVPATPYVTGDALPPVE